MVSWGGHDHDWKLKFSDCTSEYYECECGASKVVSKK